MLVNEEGVHPEVKQLSIGHVPWPSHNVHDVQLDFLCEVNLDIADYQQRVLQLDVDASIRPFHQIHVRRKWTHRGLTHFELNVTLELA
jgi:hypothetical protein